MTEWAFVLTPLMVLPIVLLFRFVGCAQIAGLEAPTPVETTSPPAQPPASPATPPAGPPPPPPPPITTPPRYRDYIMGEPNNPGSVKNNGVVPNKANVVAYWRLVDTASATVAHDEKGFQDGQYVTTVQGLPPDQQNGSEAAPGNFVTGQDSLIVSDPFAKCRFFNGGYVRVPFKPGLYTDEFTIEAWVQVTQFTAGYEHTLFDAGGRYALSPNAPESERGFRLFANDDGRWQFRLGPGTGNLFASPPKVPLAAPPHPPTHVAVTVENDGGAGGKKVYLYVDGTVVAVTSVGSYARPDNAPLFIGIDNLNPDPTSPLVRRRPVLCHVQEVVLHSKALSQDEIENHVDINR